jgi:hypothetical protein
MGLLKTLTNDTRRKFNIAKSFLTYYTGDRALVTVADVNKVIDVVNVLSANGTVDFVYRISETLGVPVLSLSLMTGATPTCKCAGCSGTENPACAGCTGVNTSTFYKCATANASLARTAPGVYELTLVPDFTYNNVVVTFGNIGFTGAIINVVRNSNVSYTIRTINTATGIAINGELTDTPIQVSFWQ